ncbi:hypothetical protein AGMMS49992_09150 [Clostridia bacterium]|nr:hypothetical protein AGMMS49992_09150 [Clostridia bacterium]
MILNIIIKTSMPKTNIGIDLDYMQNDKDVIENRQIGFYGRLMAFMHNSDDIKEAESASYLRRTLTYLDNKEKSTNDRSKRHAAFPEIVQMPLHKRVVKNFILKMMILEF